MLPRLGVGPQFLDKAFREFPVLFTQSADHHGIVTGYMDQRGLVSNVHVSQEITPHKLLIDLLTGFGYVQIEDIPTDFANPQVHELVARYLRGGHMIALHPLYFSISFPEGQISPDINIQTRANVMLALHDVLLPFMRLNEIKGVIYDPLKKSKNSPYVPRLIEHFKDYIKVISPGQEEIDVLKENRVEKHTEHLVDQNGATDKSIKVNARHTIEQPTIQRNTHITTEQFLEITDSFRFPNMPVHVTNFRAVYDLIMQVFKLSAGLPTTEIIIPARPYANLDLARIEFMTLMIEGLFHRNRIPSHIGMNRYIEGLIASRTEQKPLNIGIRFQEGKLSGDASAILHEQIAECLEDLLPHIEKGRIRVIIYTNKWNTFIPSEALSRFVQPATSK